MERILQRISEHENDDKISEGKQYTKIKKEENKIQNL